MLPPTAGLAEVDRAEHGEVTVRLGGLAAGWSAGDAHLYVTAPTGPGGGQLTYPAETAGCLLRIRPKAGEQPDALDYRRVDHATLGADEMRVQDADGNGVPGSRVFVFRFSAPPDAEDWEASGTSVTGPDGGWGWPVFLLPGLYRVEYRGPGGRRAERSILVPG